MIVFPLHGIVFPEGGGQPTCACGTPGCDRVGKHPKVAGWSALTSSEDCTRDINYAVLCGAASGIVVVDLDRADAPVPGPLPPTFTVRTGRGLHFYYVLDGTRSVRTRHGDGWDLQGDGAFVVGPGSMHRSGRTYEPIDNGVNPAPAPDWVYSYAPAIAPAAAAEEVVRTPGRVPDGAEFITLEERIANESPAVAGQNGHDVTFRFLQKYLILEHWALDAVRPLLDGWNFRCQPPWDAEDFDRKIHEVLTKSRMPEGGASDDLNERLLAASLRREAKEKTSRKHTYKFEAIPQLEGAQDAKPHPTTFEWVRQALTTGKWEGVFRRDQFYGTIRAVEPIFPMRCEGDDGVKNSDIALVRAWLEREMRWVASTKDVEAALEAASTTNDPFHPVRNYLDGCRGQTGAIAELAALLTDDPTDALAIRVWLLSAVARIYKPGAHVDMMLILAGTRGGEGKTTTFRTLFGHWHRSNLPEDLGNVQKAAQALQGSWCVEMGELPQFKKTDRDIFKDFLTRTHDKFRTPYERTEENHPRQCVFAGTSNSLSFLDQFDTAFRRRFYAIEITRTIDVARVEALRDAIWAEARDAFKAGEAIFLEAYGVEADRETRMQAFDLTDTLDDLFAHYVEKCGLKALDRKSLTNIWLALSPRSNGYPPRTEQLRLSTILTRAGFRKRKTNGETVWCAPEAARAATVAA